MTKFHLGILIGFFLGALIMFVVLGAMQLYLAERRVKRTRAPEKTGREIQDASETRS